MNTIGYVEIQSSNLGAGVGMQCRGLRVAIFKKDGTSSRIFQSATDSMAGSLLKKSLEIPASHDPANAFTCWVQEKNFDETALLILSKCGQVAMPKFAVQHKRWLGYFMDAGNNAMGIFQSDEKARWRQLSSSCRRFSKPPKGMN